jgi:hypothetical protein
MLGTEKNKNQARGRPSAYARIAKFGSAVKSFLLKTRKKFTGLALTARFYHNILPLAHLIFLFIFCSQRTHPALRSLKKRRRRVTLQLATTTRYHRSISTTCRSGKGPRFLLKCCSKCIPFGCRRKASSRFVLLSKNLALESKLTTHHCTTWSRA